MKTLQENIRKKLISKSTKNHREFIENLIPGCNNILGVKMPEIKKLAKKMTEEDKEKYLEIIDNLLYEETMLQAILIGSFKDDLELTTRYIKDFVPRISSWSICDSFVSNLKIIEKNKPFFYKHLEKYRFSENTFELRFLIVVYLTYFKEERYLEDIFNFFNSLKKEDYYVDMAVAWAISMFYIECKDKTVKYIKENQLNDFTHNKAIQKIKESLQVSKQEKNDLQKLKRKRKYK